MARSLTLIELLISVVLISLVLLAAGSLYTGATSFFGSFEFQSEMQYQANIALQDMVNNIFSAKSVEVGAENSELTVWTSSTDSFKYWLEDGEIRRGSTLDYENVAKQVKLLDFSLISASAPLTNFDTLQIRLVVDGEGKLADLQFVTKIAIREYE